MTADELLEQCRAVVPGEWHVETTGPGRFLASLGALDVWWASVEPIALPCEARLYARVAQWAARETSPRRALVALYRKVRGTTWPWPEPQEAPDTLPLTRAALAAYDAHEATECVPGEGLAWVDEHDRLRDAIGAAFAAETADVNDPAVAATVADSRSGLAFVRRCVEEAADAS